VSFERFADPRCQRGLTFVYRLDHPIDPEDFSLAIGPDFARSKQVWGSREIQIWIAPKRFECQLGVRDLELRFMHRFSASAEQRVVDRSRFEEALLTALRR
jgi:hypothetical protein